MKYLPVIVCIFATAAGAVAHRLGLSTVMEHKAQMGASAGQLAREIPVGTSSVHAYMNETDEVLAEEILASLTAEEFPRLAEEMLQRNTDLSSIIGLWAEADVGGLLIFIERYKAAGVEKEKINRWLDLAFENMGDPVVALAAAEKHGLLDEEDHVYRLSHLATALTKRDPLAALNFAAAHPQVLETVLAGWSEREPAAVLSWMRERVGKQLEQHVMDAVLGHMAQRDPKSAEKFLALAQNQEEIYHGLARSMKDKSIDEVSTWLDTLPENGRTVAYQDLSSDWRSSAPNKAAALCMTFPEFATEQNSGDAQTTLKEWAKGNPVGAIQDYQLGKIPTGVAEKILPDLVEAWFLVDRSAALAFIHAQPDSEQKGVLLLQTSRILEEGDARAGLDYALLLPEPAARLGACRRVIGQPNEENKALIASIADAAIRKALLEASN
jgi:hypothetical protein